MTARTGGALQSGHASSGGAGVRKNVLGIIPPFATMRPPAIPKGPTIAYSFIEEAEPPRT
jgi:hypothetical protein